MSRFCNGLPVSVAKCPRKASVVPRMTPTCITPMGMTPESTARLRGRAGHLRSTSVGMHAVVAQAYRRRASELEFEAWLTEVCSGQAGAAA